MSRLSPATNAWSAGIRHSRQLAIWELSVPGLGVGTCKLDLSPGGVVAFTRPGGTAMRLNLLTGRRKLFRSVYPDDLLVEFDPATGNLNVFFYGASALFNAPLTDSDRTG